MASKRDFKWKGTTDYLIHREFGFGNTRRDLKIVKAKVSDRSIPFEKRWEHTSTKNIVFNEWMFLNNFNEVRTKSGELMFSLGRPNDSKLKLVAVLVYELILGHPSQNKIIGLTQNGYLQTYDFYTGRLLSNTLTALWSDCKFRYLQWETVDHRFYIKSTLVGSVATNTASIVLALFDIEPYKLIAKFRIPRSVFGKTMRDVTLMDGVLIVCHAKDVMKCYGIQEILDNCRIEGKPKVELDDLESGQGIPDTHEIKTEPRILFQLTTDSHFLELGGEPMFHIHSPSKNEFQIRLLRNGQLVENGTLQPPLEGIDSDVICFYDNHYKLYWQTPSLVSVFRIEKQKLPSTSNAKPMLLEEDESAEQTNNNNNIGGTFYQNLVKMYQNHHNEYKYTLIKEFEVRHIAESFKEKKSNSTSESPRKPTPELSPEARTSKRARKATEIESSKLYITDNNMEVTNKNSTEESQDEYYHTKRGRKIKVLVPISYEDERAIQSVEYENELDLMTVCVAGKAIIYDNKTGQLLRKVSLKFWPLRDWKHQVILDRDLLIHLASNVSTKTCKCTVYKLGSS